MTTNFAKLTGAEIFSTGTWNKLPFDEAALDSIVSAFNALNLAGKVPLKLSHEGPDARSADFDPTKKLAMGWVTRVWRDGKKLFADFDMPQKVHDLVREGYLKFVSIELLKDVKASTREIPWVLDAVALLGSDQPAVGVLKDLQALTMSRTSASLPNGGCVTFARADRVSTTTSPGEHFKMSDDNKGGPTLQELMDRMLSMQNQMSALAEERDGYKKQISAFSQTKQRLADMEEAAARREREERRAAINAVFERAIENEDIVPAARERFMKSHRVADDEYVLEVTVDDAKEFIRDNPSQLPKRKSKPAKFSLDRPDADVPPGTRADDEALMRAKALLASRNIHAPNVDQLIAATKEVFTVNPNLGESYKVLHDQLARDAAVH